MKRPYIGERKRETRMSDDISVSGLKRSSKLYKCSITEACHTVISQTLKEYSVQKGDDKLKDITITSTFSTAPMPTSLQEVTWGNFWVPQYLTLPVESDFKKALFKNKENIRSLIGSNKIMGMDLFISTILQLPFNLAQYSFILLSQKITLTMSSAPGPKEPL